MNKVNRMSLAVAASALLATAHMSMAAEDGMAADIEKIDSAWGEVTREFNALVTRNLSVVADGDATERFNAYKNALAMAMEMYTNTLYRSSSRDQPEYLPYLSPLHNSCQPSFPTRYGMAFVEPGASYRVWGKRGNPVDIDIQQWTSYPGFTPGYPISAKGAFANQTFSAQHIKIDKQGRFEFTLSATKPPKGQWWKLENNVRALLFRDYYADYSEAVVPPEYHLEKIGARDKRATTLSADEAAERLRTYATALKSQDVCFEVPKPLNQVVRHTVFSDPSDKNSGSAAQVDQDYYFAQFLIKPGQALIVEWRPPAKSLYWNFELNTRSGQSFNFGARQVDMTGKMVHVDNDGKVRFVISHEDTHLANWLDLDGNDRGVLWGRCKKCSATETPVAKLVNIDQIMESLPKDTKMVTDAERQRQLELRRKHYQTRYGL